MKFDFFVLQETLNMNFFITINYYTLQPPRFFCETVTFIRRVSL